MFDFGRDRQNFIRALNAQGYDFPLTLVGVGAHDDPRTNGLQLVRIGAMRAVVGASPYGFISFFGVCSESTKVRIYSKAPSERELSRSD